MVSRILSSQVWSGNCALGMRKTIALTGPLRAPQALLSPEDPRFLSLLSILFKSFFRVQSPNSHELEVNISTATTFSCPVKLLQSFVQSVCYSSGYEGNPGRQKMQRSFLLTSLDRSWGNPGTNFTLKRNGGTFGASGRSWQMLWFSHSAPLYCYPKTQWLSLQSGSVRVMGKSRMQEAEENLKAKEKKDKELQTGSRKSIASTKQSGVSGWGRVGENQPGPRQELLDTNLEPTRNDILDSHSLYKTEDESSDTEDDDSEFRILENEMEEEVAGEIEFEDLSDDDDTWDDDDEADDVVVGDGGYGGGVVLGDTEWGKQSLDLAKQVLAESGGDLSIFAFKASRDGRISVRLDKLSDLYGSPTMRDIERFTKRFRGALEDPSVAGSLPDNFDLEVSSPGAERVLRVPEDLERFKELPMYVQYLEGGVASDQEVSERDGVLQLESVDIKAGISVWKTADVKINRQAKGKGRPLNSQQRKWRASVPFASLKQLLAIKKRIVLNVIDTAWT